MTVQTTTVTGPSGCPLTVIAPAGADRYPRAIVVVQDAWGIADHLLGQGASLAEHGFLVVLPHLFHRTGDPVFDPGPFERVVPHMKALNADTIGADIGDALRHARDLGAEKVGVVGFCMGGTVSLWATARAGFDAGVTFYGGGVAEGRWPGVPAGLELAAEIRVPWLGLYGDEDASIPVEQIEQLRAIVDALPVATDVVRYPGAGHAFAGDPRSPQRRDAAAQDAWARTITWFEAHLA